MVTLETARLLIRNFRATDWEALYEIITQYEQSEFAAYDQSWPTAPEKIREVTDWFASGDSYLAVCLKGTDRCIGFVALNHEPKREPEGESLTFNLGYIFNFDYHGQGYATEACRAMLDYAFHARQAQQIVSGTAAANRASCQLLARLGFRKIAESTGSFRNAPDGTPIEFVGYSFALTRDQWQRVVS